MLQLTNAASVGWHNMKPAETLPALQTSSISSSFKNNLDG